MITVIAHLPKPSARQRSAPGGRPETCLCERPDGGDVWAHLEREREGGRNQEGFVLMMFINSHVFDTLTV